MGIDEDDHRITGSTFSTRQEYGGAQWEGCSKVDASLWCAEAFATGAQGNRARDPVRIRENRARGSVVILDTNALSALLDKEAALLEAIRNSRELALPVIVLGEFRFGISVSRRRNEYLAWLRRDLSLFRVLPVVEETSVYYATIRSELKAGGSPIPANDAWIAALARQHRMPIVSRDTHFDKVKNIERLGWS
jgi:predicted nucleic acid-binding protein